MGDRERSNSVSRGLQVALLAHLAALVVLPILLHDLHTHGTEMVREQVLEQQCLLARETAVAVTRVFSLLGRELDLLAGELVGGGPLFTGAAARAAARLEFVRGLHVDAVAVFDTQGAVRLALGTPAPALSNSASRGYFATALASTTGHPIQAVVPSPDPSPAHGRVVLAVPVRASNTHPEGVVQFTVQVGALLASTLPAPDSMREAWVVTDDGTVLYHPTYPVGSQYPDSTLLADLRQNAASAQGCARPFGYTAESGRQMLASASRIPFGEDAWTVVVAVDEAVVGAPLAALTRGFLAVSVTVLGILLLGWISLAVALRRWNRTLETSIRLKTAELSQSGEKLRSLVETIGDCIWEVDAHCHFTYVSPKIYPLLGFRESELLGQSIETVMPPPVVARTKATICGGCGTSTAAELEFDALGRNGEVRRLETSLAPVTLPDGCFGGCRGAFRDVTDRWQGEQEVRRHRARLQSLALKLCQTEEQERQRIGGEFHDRVGQPLALARIQLGRLGTALEGPLADELEAVRALLKQTLRETSSLTFELSSPLLRELGLDAALESTVAEMTSRYGVVAEFRGVGGRRGLSNDLQAFLYRAVRELLANVAKHAGPCRVQVSLTTVDGFTTALVEDDGSGFAADACREARPGEGGFGLFSLRERVEALGGRLEIHSAPGKGTRVTLRLGPATPPYQEESS